MQGGALKELLQQLAVDAQQAKSSDALKSVIADVKFAQQVQTGWTSEAQKLVKAAHSAVVLRGVQLKHGH
jgi:hypothetical protein